jgi:hypothetical protein
MNILNDIRNSEARLYDNVTAATYLLSTINRIRPILESLSDKASFFSNTTCLRVISNDREDFRKFRECFPNIVWDKRFDKEDGTLVYSKFIQFGIFIYFQTETPPNSCKLIAEEINVPAGKKKVFRMECSKAENDEQILEELV